MGFRVLRVDLRGPATVLDPLAVSAVAHHAFMISRKHSSPLGTTAP